MQTNIYERYVIILRQRINNYLVHDKKYVYIQWMRHIDFHKCKEEEKP